MVEKKDLGGSPDVETRKMKGDRSRTAAIEAAKLAQQQAAESGQQKQTDSKQQ